MSHVASSANSVPCQGGQCRDSGVSEGQEAALAGGDREGTGGGAGVTAGQREPAGGGAGELTAVGEPGVNSEDIQEARCDFFLAVFLGLLGLE